MTEDVVAYSDFLSGCLVSGVGSVKLEWLSNDLVYFSRVLRLFQRIKTSDSRQSNLRNPYLKCTLIKRSFQNIPV